MSKTVIQHGHKPFEPIPTESFLGRPDLEFPIGSAMRKGSSDVYHGKKGSMYSTTVEDMACPKSTELSVLCIEGNQTNKAKTDASLDKDEVDGEYHEEENPGTLAKTLLENLKIIAATLVSSQPFYVVAVRIIEEVLEKEQKYKGVFAYASEIYKESGISGFFQGIPRRMASELIVVSVVASVSLAINTYMNRDVRRKPSKSSCWVLSTLTYFSKVYLLIQRPVEKMFAARMEMIYWGTH